MLPGERSTQISDLRTLALGRALGVIGLTLLFKGTLDVLYLGLVYARYQSEGYLLQPSAARLIGSYLLAVCFTLAFNCFLRRDGQPGSIVVSLYAVFVATPLLTLYGMMAVPIGFVLSVLGCILVATWILGATPRLVIRPPSPGIVRLFVVAAALVTVYVYGSLLQAGAGEFNLDLYKVYQFRANLNASSFPLMGYLLPLQGYVINIAGLIYGMNRKRYWMIGLALLLQVILFGLTNFKAFLFSPLLVVGLYFGVKRRNPLLLILVTAVGLALLLFLLDVVLGEIMFGGILVRLFYTPAFLHYVHYDFFSVNPFVLMSDARLSFLFDNPYGMSYVHVIAMEYWGRLFSPNVGFLGDAYANFGIPGMLAISLLLGMFLKLVDSVSILVEDRNIAVSMIAIPGFALVNSAFFTSLLTHGLLASLIALWIFSRHAR